MPSLKLAADAMHHVLWAISVQMLPTEIAILPWQVLTKMTSGRASQARTYQKNRVLQSSRELLAN